MSTITSKFSIEELWNIAVLTNWYGQATVELLKGSPVDGDEADFQYRIFLTNSFSGFDRVESRRFKFINLKHPQVIEIGNVNSGLTVLPTPLQYHSVEECISYCRTLFKHTYQSKYEIMGVIHKSNRVDDDYLDLDFEVTLTSGIYKRRENRRFKLYWVDDNVDVFVIIGEPNTGLTTPCFTINFNQQVPYPGTIPINPDVNSEFVDSDPALRGFFDIKDKGYYLCPLSKVILSSTSTRLELVPSTTDKNVFFIRTATGSTQPTQYLECTSDINVRWTDKAPSVNRRPNYEWVLTDALESELNSSAFKSNGYNTLYQVRNVAFPKLTLQYLPHLNTWGGGGKTTSIEFISVR